jgi:hypothetical protein
MWCSNGDVISNEGPAQVEKVLHDALCIRVQAPRVVT